MSADLPVFSDNTQRLSDTILAGGFSTTFGDYTTYPGQFARVRSWAIFGGNPASAMYLYRYNGVFDYAKLFASGEGLIAAINGGTGYINPIRYLMYPDDKLAVLLGAVSAGAGVRVNVELEFAPAGTVVKRR